MTLEEAWSGNKPNISDIRIFGSQVFMHIPEKERGKLSTCSLICMFLGFAEHCKAYKLVHQLSCRLLQSHNVIFDEGGLSPCFEHITIENNDTSSSIIDSTPPSMPQPPALQLQPQL
jgi:hypothetical protein